MPKRTKDYHTWLLNRLAEPREAERYLKVAMADSGEMFLKALRNVAEAKKMAKVAEEAGVNRESLYKALSEEGNPRLSTLASVLSVLGMSLTVKLDQVTPNQSEPAPILDRTQNIPIAPIIFGTGNIFTSASNVTSPNVQIIVIDSPTLPILRGNKSQTDVPLYLLGQSRTSSGP